MNNMKVKHGDIVVFHGHGFVSEGIQFFMNCWRWVNFQFKPFYKKVPNHIAMGDYNNFIIEAIENGIKCTGFPRTGKGPSTIKVYRYEWSERQNKEIDKYYGKYLNTPYQYSNFLFWIIYILTFGLVWVGRRGKDSDKKLYCSEFAARVIYQITDYQFSRNEVDRDAHRYFRDYWKINPLQLERWCEVNCKLVATYEIKDWEVTEL